MPFERLQRIKDTYLILYPFLLLTSLLVLSSFSGTCQKTNSSGEGFSTGVQSILKNIHAPVFKDSSYSIISYGAIPDGKTNVKPVFDSVITLCSNSGGGEVIVPKGRYFVQGALVLKSHVHLH